jgi:hypothetical protein
MPKDTKGRYTTGFCACETVFGKCDHQGSCPRPPGTATTPFGSFCDECASRMPKQYLYPPHGTYMKHAAQPKIIKKVNRGRQGSFLHHRPSEPPPSITKNITGEVKNMNKNFKTIAEALASGKIKDANLSTESVNHRRLTVDEIKAYLMEEFGKAKEVSDVKAKEVEKGWGDAELEKTIDWVKTLQLKEFFKK